MSGLPLLVSLLDEQLSIDVLADQLSWDGAQVKLAKKLFRRGLPPLVDTQTLPYLFGVRPKFVSAMGRFPERYYRSFSLPKHRGPGTRTVQSPRQALKVIQQWTYQHILLSLKLPPCVMGFVRGRSIVDNARHHTAGRNLMVVDVQDFFPSIRIEQVQKVFRDIGFPDSVSGQLASLCCIYGRLPQGAPTSPALANAVFSGADSDLRGLASSWKCQYTRYADDLAFSGGRHFSKVDVRQIGAILKRYGFAINPLKTRRQGPGGRQLVTGLVTNVNVQPPRWKRRTWRAMFHRASNHPREFADRWRHLLGIAAFVKQYDQILAKRYRKIARSLLHGARTRPRRAL